MKQIYLTLFLSTLLIVSCQQKEQDGGSSVVVAPVAESQEKISPLIQRADTLLIEGMPEPVTLQLYQSPPAWPFSFYTYLPPQMQAQTQSSGEGDAVVFAFSDARLTFFTFPETVDREEAKERAKAALATSEMHTCENKYEWQWSCFVAADDPSQIKKVYVGENSGRYFYFLVHMPAEYADGFTPRYNLILDEWQWNK